MAVIQNFVLVAVMALAAITSAAPSAKPKPFYLPATYLTGGLGGMSIDFNEDGTFSTKRALPPSVCDNNPVCPELGGKGTWSYSQDSRQITLSQKITNKWTVTQVWRMGAASRDLYSSLINGNQLVKSRGYRSKEFPLPEGAGNWKRSNVPNNAAKPKPFTLPATYLTGGLGGVSITVNEDGTFRTSRALSPSVCANKPVCPERGGKGTWTWNQEKRQFTLKEEIAAGWTTEQVWELNAMSRDANTSVINGARLVSSKGKDATKYPIPEGVSNWSRSN